MKRKLLLSYTGLISAIQSDVVKAQDLSNALLFFACTREHAINPGASGEYNELERHCKNPEEREKIHDLIVGAIREAEANGRAAWRTLEEGNQSIEKLNVLLAANGYPTLTDPEGYYSYPHVEELVAAQIPDLEVVWHG